MYRVTQNPFQTKPTNLLYYLLPFVVEQDLCGVSLSENLGQQIFVSHVSSTSHYNKLNTFKKALSSKRSVYVEIYV